MTQCDFNSRRRALLLAAGALGVVHSTAFATGVSATSTKLGEAQRVIVVGGAIAEIVYQLGDQDRLVAADITCTYPPATARLPKIGYQRTLSAEGLLAMRPHLLLSSAEAGPPGVLDQIRAAGVRVVTLTEGHDSASVSQKIHGVAQALGDIAGGQQLLDRFERDWRTAQAQIAASAIARRSTPLRVAFVLNEGGNQAMIAGQKTAANAMITLAGAQNALRDFNGYRPVTAEALVAAAPDVILTTDDTLRAAGGRAGLFANPAFANTPAGRAKRLVAMDTLLLLGFGPRLPKAASQLNLLLEHA